MNLAATLGLISLGAWGAVETMGTGVLERIAHFACVAFVLQAGRELLMLLGGNLLTSHLGKEGYPFWEGWGPDRDVAATCVALFPALMAWDGNVWALQMLGVCAFVATLIRLVQWNGIEPDGITQYGCNIDRPAR